MDLLAKNTNVLFGVWLRSKNTALVMLSKLKKPMYHFKFIHALTTVIKANTQTVWTLNGRFHREEYFRGRSLPAIIYNDGTMVWYRHGKCHRDEIIFGESQPAVVNGNGIRSWWINDENHRTDGPAIVHPTGECVYYLHDREIDPTKLISEITTVVGKIKRKLEKVAKLERYANELKSLYKSRPF